MATMATTATATEIDPHRDEIIRGCGIAAEVFDWLQAALNEMTFGLNHDWGKVCGWVHVDRVVRCWRYPYRSGSSASLSAFSMLVGLMNRGSGRKGLTLDDAQSCVFALKTLEIDINETLPNALGVNQCQQCPG